MRRECLSRSRSTPQRFKDQIHDLNPSSNIPLFASDGSKIDCVEDFKYLGGYSDTEHNMSVRIVLAWSALHYVTLKSIIEEETGMSGQELLATMADRKCWYLDYVHVSPEPSGNG